MDGDDALLDLGGDLGTALRRHQLGVAVQRCLDLRTDDALGEEVFVRWRHPDRGDLPAAAFLIGCPRRATSRVDRRVAAETLRLLRARLADGERVPELWLNLALTSLDDVRTRRLLTRIATLLRANGTGLVLELRHLELLTAGRRTVRHLRRLTRRGVAVHVDAVRLDALESLDVEGLRVRAVKLDAAALNDPPVPAATRPGPHPDEATLHEWGLAHGVLVIVSRLETPAQRSRAQREGLWLAQGNLVAPPITL